MDVTAAWLAGLLEGEGSFSLSGHKQPNIKVEMTDEDVVRRAAALLGSRNISRRISNQGYKDSFIVRIAGQRAADWMVVLHPIMGIRRQSQILRVFNEQPSP
jgi:hypothetical protein